MERAAAHLDFPKSITYKIRLNDELKIKEVGLCKINSQFFSNRSKRDRIIKWNDIASQKYRANSFFSKKMKTEEETPGAIELLLLSQEEPKLLFTDEPSAIAKDIQALLIDALDQVLHTQSNSLLSRIKAFRALIKQHFGLLHKELAFLIKGLQMIQRLNREHESSFPQLVSAEERTFIVNNAFHPALALNGPVVFNPVNLNQWGDVLLLSGINTGGKTTYLQTVGSIQLLAQLGLPVPGTDPVISVAENIVLAFSVNETAENHQGRLHQELQILKEAAIHIGPNSFFLFNEPLTGSSPMVCAQIMNEILSIVKVLNGRGVWVSHLTSSVEKFERFNQRLPGSRIGSIYVALDHGAPDYHIHAGSLQKTTTQPSCLTGSMETVGNLFLHNMDGIIQASPPFPFHAPSSLGLNCRAKGEQIKKTRRPLDVAGFSAYLPGKKAGERGSPNGDGWNEAPKGKHTNIPLNKRVIPSSQTL